MVKLTIRFSNGDSFTFESEAAHAHEWAVELATAWYAQRDIVAQQKIDSLTDQLSKQNDRLATGVSDNKPPVEKDPAHHG